MEDRGRRESKRTAARAGLISLALVFVLRSADAVAGLPVLRLAWFDVHGAAPFAYDSVTGEVARLLQGLGAQVAWRQAEAGGASGADETQVILLASPPSSPSLSPRTMGATPKDRSIKAIWVFVPNVAWTLGMPARPELWSQRQRRELARALGRVITHELVHALAPDHPHSTGLMNSTLGRDALLREGLRLDGSAVRAFRSALSPLPKASESAASGTRSGAAGRF